MKLEKKMKKRVKTRAIIAICIIILFLLSMIAILGVMTAKIVAVAQELFGEKEAIHACCIEPMKPMETLPPMTPIAPMVEEAVAKEAAEQSEETKITDHPVGVCEITAYCTCVKCCGIWSEDRPSRQGTDYVQKTATGTRPTAGRTVAVDPNVIPLGSVVMINGVGYIAEDTGNAVKGKVVDIYFDSHQDAVEFGRQTATVSYIY